MVHDTRRRRARRAYGHSTCRPYDGCVFVAVPQPFAGRREGATTARSQGGGSEPWSRAWGPTPSGTGGFTGEFPPEARGSAELPRALAKPEPEALDHAAVVEAGGLVGGAEGDEQGRKVLGARVRLVRGWRLVE